jgi:hypothetical protein
MKTIISTLHPLRCHVFYKFRSFRGSQFLSFYTRPSRYILNTALQISYKRLSDKGKSRDSLIGITTAYGLDDRGSTLGEGWEF